MTTLKTTILSQQNALSVTKFDNFFHENLSRNVTQNAKKYSVNVFEYLELTSRNEQFLVTCINQFSNYGQVLLLVYQGKRLKHVNRLQLSIHNYNMKLS